MTRHPRADDKQATIAEALDRLREELRIVCQVLDEIRDELAWANRNHTDHDVVANLANRGETPAQAAWGKLNTTAIRHPLSSAIPFAGWLLDMPAQALDGDQYMPRVQGPKFGASERMLVAPGHEELGYFHMPGGQSGHPLSPFYGAGHEEWAAGRASPFLPGPAIHRLTLTP